MTASLDALGRRLFELLDSRALDDRLRSHAAAELPAPDEVRPCWPSLSKAEGDGKLYLAADRGRDPILLTFDRRDRDVSAQAIPFSSLDRAALRDFAERVDRSFLPRPQGDLPAIAVGNRHPEISLPAAFEAFERVQAKLGVNMASTVQLSATREMTLEEDIERRSGEDPTEIGHTRVSIERLYHAGLWAAIRAGWRRGYTAEADHFIVTGETEAEIDASVEAVEEAIRRAAGYTKFTTDSSRLFELEADPRSPNGWADHTVEERFEQLFDSGERSWILGEFSRPFEIEDRSWRFSPGQIRRFAVKFGRSLRLNERLYDAIRQAKGGEPFDFEPSIDEAATLTSAEEMLFYMHWLTEHGRPAALVPPNLGFKKRQAYPETQAALRDYVKGKMWPELAPRVEREFGGDPLEELGARVRDLAAVARSFNATLSIHSGSGKQARVLEMIGRSTAGRVNYKISGELQLQLLDVLAEQPQGSRWRSLFERMADACNAFGDRNAFGPESALAEVYRQKGLQHYLGEASRGRVDGNLFLVFWIGNLAGTRDEADPEGDRRFFTEKFDDLPADLLAEVRRRNRDYIVWLAENLRP